MTQPRYVIIHGHFYQPPRESPWTGLITREPTAAPFASSAQYGRLKAINFNPNISYRFTDHLAVAAQAIDDGIPLTGFYAWSLLDNFEWALGYTKRFGIVYCDYADCRRVPKDSFYYYREVIAGHER